MRLERYIMKFRSMLLAGCLATALLLTPAAAQDDTVSVGSLAVMVPQNWYETDVPGDEVDTGTVIVSNDEQEDQAIVMISVVPRNGRSLESMSSQTRRYIAKEMDGVLEYERSTSLDGAPAHMFVYEGRSEHSDLGRRKFMRAIVEKGNDFYIIHGVANHVPFANYAGTMEDIVNSAKWK